MAVSDTARQCVSTKSQATFTGSKPAIRQAREYALKRYELPTDQFIETDPIGTYISPLKPLEYAPATKPIKRPGGTNEHEYYRRGVLYCRYRHHLDGNNDKRHRVDGQPQCLRRRLLRSVESRQRWQHRRD